MDYTFIKNAFKEVNLKVVDHQTVSDGFYDYNIFDFEFTTDGYTFQDSVKIKIGNNVKNGFQNYLNKCFSIDYVRDVPPVFTKEQQKLLDKMNSLII